MLSDYGLHSHLAVVNDNNDIDREVTKHKPTHVIIEALWVVPGKFKILTQLHPNVKWIIRLHSNLPFIANEGMAMDWIPDYLQYKNLHVAVNSLEMLDSIRLYIGVKMNFWDKDQIENKVIYLPNYYPKTHTHKDHNKNKNHIDIGCFGAIRPLKNQLVQAMAAIEFAEKNGKELHFHINTGRIEGKGDAILHNLEHLFHKLRLRGHKLIKHEWVPRELFLELCGDMDIGLQVSFSETFNIVGADLISNGTPLVGSKEIPWSSSMFNADPTNAKEITKKLQLAYRYPKLNVRRNRKLLDKYVDKSKSVWIDYLLGK